MVQFGIRTKHQLVSHSSYMERRAAVYELTFWLCSPKWCGCMAKMQTWTWRMNEWMTNKSNRWVQQTRVCQWTKLECLIIKQQWFHSFAYSNSWDIGIFTIYLNFWNTVILLSNSGIIFLPNFLKIGNISFQKLKGST